MMKSSYVLLIVAAIAISGCGPSAQERADIEQRKIDQDRAEALAKAEEAKAKAENECVLAAMNTMVGISDAVALLTSVNAANLSTCPSDFSEVFTDYRGKLSFAIDKAREADAHSAGGNDAAGAGFAVTVFEAATGSNTGATPFADWNRREAEIGGEVRSAMDALVQAKQQVLVVGARHGVTVTTASSPSDSSSDSAK